MRVTLTALFVTAAVSAAVAAQKSETLVGCLEAGATNGSFVLALPQSQPIPVMSTRIGLTGHLRRKVSVDGRRATFRGEPVFKVQKLTVLASSCE
jgi:hypothetical protein